MKTIDCNTTISLAAEQHDLTLRAVGARFAASVKEAIIGVFMVLQNWQVRALMRHRMADLDERLLDDIGLTREQVETEAEKPFWLP